MEGPRAVKVEELGKTIELINKVFRESSGLAPTMQYEFPTLLSKENCDNIRVFF